MTLTDFLLARIAEDEEVARAGVSNQEDEGWSLVAVEATGRVVLSPHVGIIHERVQGEHIERWDPWRVLAECEAKRRIVEKCGQMSGPFQVDRIVTPATVEAAARADSILHDVALPYVEHPDFREEWRV